LTVKGSSLRSRTPEYQEQLRDYCMDCTNFLTVSGRKYTSSV
jgi:hypothetical protein